MFLFLCFVFSSQAFALFAHDVVPCLVVVYHLVNQSPIGQTADVTVINPHVYFQLAGEVIVPFLFFFGIVFVDGVKLNATLATPVDAKESFNLINELSETKKLPNMSIVLNGVDMTKKKYGYYYGYGKYGKYGHYGRYGRYGKGS